MIDEIANQLIESGVVNRVGCVVETDAQRRYFETESSVSYSTVDVTPDLSPDGNRTGRQQSDHRHSGTIERLRDDYGNPFLTPVVVSDHRYDSASRDAWRMVVERGFGFFEERLAAFDPTILVTPRLSRPIEWIPARIVSREGTYMWWQTTRVGSQYGLIENTHLEKFEDVIERFVDIYRHDADPKPHAKQQAQEYLSEVREHGTRPDFYARREDSYRTSPLKLLFPYGVPRLKELRELVENRLSSETDFDSHRLPKLTNVVRRVQTRVRQTFEPPRGGEPFVFFPLHAQPEPSTRIIAPMYEDQITLARQLSRSLPVEYRLYVKDHPRMFRDNTRPIGYYQELASIPGVRLLSPTEDSHTIIQNAAAVATVVGTTALEAAYFETPSIVFGSTHFTALACISRCRDLSRLSTLVSEALFEQTVDTTAVIDYLTAIFECSFEVTTSADVSTTAGKREFGATIAPQLIERLQNHQ